jgi:hypothetical protein
VSPFPKITQIKSLKDRCGSVCPKTETWDTKKIGWDEWREMRMQAKEKTKTARYWHFLATKNHWAIYWWKKLMVRNAVTEALYQYINGWISFQTKAANITLLDKTISVHNFVIPNTFGYNWRVGMQTISAKIYTII